MNSRKRRRLWQSVIANIAGLVLKDKWKGLVVLVFFAGCFAVQSHADGRGVSAKRIEGEREMSYWLHRISHHADVSHPLLDQGYLSIGWSGFSEQGFVEKSRSDGMGYFNSTIKGRWGELRRSRWSLWRYIAEMKSGDLVIVPQWKSFSIYRLVGDRPLIASELAAESSAHQVDEEGHLFQNVDGEAKKIDLGFFWRVEEVHVGISRGQYADQKLTSRMKIRSTTACLNALKDSVDRAMESFARGEPLNLYSSILDSSQEPILSMIRKDLNPDKFEKLVKWYFKRVGATSVIIPAKNEPGKEGDADTIAVFEGIKTIIYVQAKHHTNITSSWALEQINDYVSQKDGVDDGYAKVAWVVSSADGYTDECREVALKNQVVLIDGKEFSRMLLEAGIATLDDIF